MNNREMDIKGMVTWKMLLSGSLIVSALLLFAFIADEAVIEKEKMFDDRVIHFFDSITIKGFIPIMKVFTFLGSSAFLIPFYTLLIAFYFIKRNFLFGMYILIITVGSTALFSGLKLIFHRQRPNDPVIKGVSGFSFPSGHSLSAFVFSSILIYIVWNSNFKLFAKWILSTVLVLLAITIGISRIVLKVHYPTDVIASFCVGIIWVVVSLWVLQIKINKANAHLR